MVHTVHFAENKHAVAILNSMKQMKLETDLCDFKIAVRGMEYHTHKVILALSSPYFKAMFKHKTKENQEGKVELKDVDSECVRSCIEYIYTGVFDIPDEKIGDLLHVAIMMQLDDVKDALCHLIEEDLNPENFYEIRNVSEMYDLRSLCTKCQVFYEENFMAISTQPRFLNETKCDVIEILKSRNYKLSEKDKLDVSLRWVGTDSERKEILLELIKLVKLREVASEILSDVVLNHPVVKNDLRLYKLINEPLLTKMFSPTVAMTTKRYGDASNDANRILLLDSNRYCLHSYDPVLNVISEVQTESFQLLPDFFTVAYVDSFLYILAYDKSVHRLNLRDQGPTWERMRDLIADHGYHPPVVSFLGRLLIVGSSDDATDVVERFDPSENQSLRLMNKPQPVEDPTMVFLENSIYCIGGWCELESVAPFCRFTPSTSEWIDLNPMRVGGRCWSAVAADQTIFVMGSLYWDSEFYGEYGYMRTIERYDTTSGQWTSLTRTIARTMDNHETIVAYHFKGSIVAVPCHERLEEVEKYDIANDKWVKVNINKTFHVSHAVAVNI